MRDSINGMAKTYCANGIDVIEAQGELTLHSISGFKEAVSSLAGVSEHLLVDLRKVSFIDSAALEQMAIALSRQFDDNKHMSILTAEGTQPNIVLETTGFGQLVRISTDPLEVGL